MRRLVLLLLFVVMPAQTALAFDPNVRTAQRVGILAAAADDDDLDARQVAAQMRRHLARELSKEGFDVFDSRKTIDDLMREHTGEADAYIEFVGGGRDGHQYGGAGFGGRHVGVGVGVMVSRVAASLRLYDGETLEIIDEIDVEARDTSMLPTAIGVGGRWTGLWVGLPLQAIRYRSVIRAAARDAAASIAAILAPEAALE